MCTKQELVLWCFFYMMAESEWVYLCVFFVFIEWMRGKLVVIWTNKIYKRIFYDTNDMICLAQYSVLLPVAIHPDSWISATDSLAHSGKMFCFCIFSFFFFLFVATIIQCLCGWHIVFIKCLLHIPMTVSSCRQRNINNISQLDCEK